MLGGTGDVWIFQTGPEEYDILGALAALDHLRWDVKRYRSRIKIGDTALIWMSGKQGGIYAVGKVTSNPEIRGDLPKAEKYYMRESDKGQKIVNVDIEIQRKLLSTPVLRNRIKEIPELQNLSIMKFAHGTNFPVTAAEWKTIRALI